MASIVRRVGLGFLVLAGLLVVLLGGILAFDRPSTAPIAGDAAVAEVSHLADEESQRTLVVRGEDREAPILLFLDEPFGWTGVAFAARTRPLEKDFVVVHWNAFGGRSDCARPSPESLLRDLRDLSASLAARFGRRPILVAHSASARVALAAAGGAPADFQALVLVQPLVDLAAVRTDFVAGGGADTPGSLATALQRDLHAGVPTRDLLLEVFRAPELTLAEKVRFVACLGVFGEDSWDGYVVAPEGPLPRPEVPVHLFVAGRSTIVDPGAVVHLATDLGVEPGHLHRFEGSGYHPMIEEPEAFATALRETLTTGQGPAR